MHLITRVSYSYIIKHDLKRFMGQEIPLFMLPDSKMLFDVVTGNKCFSESILMVHVAAVRGAFNQRVISNIGFIRRDCNAVDGMTKIESNTALKQLLETHRIMHPVDQYIIDSQDA